MVSKTLIENVSAPVWLLSAMYVKTEGEFPEPLISTIPLLAGFSIAQVIVCPVSSSVAFRSRTI